VTAVAPGLELCKCLTCHVRFAPTDGPCPKCGSGTTEAYRSSGLAVVLAATALEVPPPGWERPHPLALVELEDGVRLLVIPDDRSPPAPRSLVEVRREGGLYRARAAPEAKGKRGEGDAPDAGVARPPFEPPR